MHRHASTAFLLAAACAATLTVGCEGYIHSGGPPGAESNPTAPPTDQPPAGETCSSISPGETPLPRLTESEYNRTIADLFPALSFDPFSVPGDEKVGPFEANVTSSVGDLVASQYQSHAETVSQALVDNLTEVVTCATVSAAEIYRGEAEQIGADVGAEQGDFWNLWTNGSIDATVTAPTDGVYEIAVRAYGNRAGGELPEMLINVDGDTIATISVDATRDQPAVYRAELELTAGPHTVSAIFTNDYYNETTGDNRDLLIDRIVATQQRRVEATDECMRGFITDLGRRSFRRPLTDDERARIWQLFDWGRTEYGMTTGLRAVVEGLLQSPKFLYRFSVGEASGAEVVELTDYEVASRLSYFLWDSMPDEELLAAADTGQLSTPEGIAEQARRMLATQKARRAVNRNFMKWMGLDDLSALERDDPTFDAQMRESFEAATLAFIDQVIWEGDGRLSTLLTAPFAYVDKQTAPLYGVEPPDDDGLVRVDLESDKRLGLLTQPAVLARYAYGDTTVHRGLFIRDAFLCSRPPPPPNEFTAPPETYEGQPARERAEDRMSHQECGTCHLQIDPLGLAFDQYDELGRWQSVDAHDNPLESSGALTGIRGGAQPVDGAVELARALAGSEEVRRCVVRQWFRLSFARTTTREDACSMRRLEEAFVASGDDIRELLVEIATSETFRYRRALDLDASPVR